MTVIPFSNASGNIEAEVQDKRANVTEFNGVFRRSKENTITLMKVEAIRYLNIESSISVKVMGWDERRIEIRINSSLEKPVCKISTDISIDELIILASNETGKKDESAVLEILLPKWAFEEVSIETMDGDIFVGGGIEAQILTLITKLRGKIYSEVYFRTGDFKTSNKGDVTVRLEPVTSVNLDVNVSKGDVNIELVDIEAVCITAETLCGKVNNFYESNGKFLASVSVSVMKGDITIK